MKKTIPLIAMAALFAITTVAANKAFAYSASGAPKGSMIKYADAGNARLTGQLFAI